MKPAPSRAFRNKPAHPFSKSILPYAAYLLSVLGIALLTTVYYFAIRNHNVELSFDQLSAFERQVSTIGNRSVYLIEPPRKDEVLASLSTQEWAKVSAHIDFVAFLYDDPFAIVNSAWLAKVVQAFESMPLKGYGIVLFPCGCVVPNKVFVSTQTRFNGAECTMLPGFVMESEAVAFVETGLVGDMCKNRNAVLGTNWYETNAWKLEEARKEHDVLQDSLSRKEGKHEPSARGMY